MNAEAYCEEHDKAFKGPNARGNYWHVINFEKNEFCNKPAADFVKPAYTPGMEQKAKEIRELTAGEQREPVGNPDWDEIARGKVRHGIFVAVIESDGLEAALTKKELMDKAVEYVMSGK